MQTKLEKYNDWDFPEGRIRQAQRMRHQQMSSVVYVAVADFVCHRRN